ncbi:hypothetical protein NQ318_005621 [Aromia moschata]|uniref:Uncharacterized protein n=1 Tax=Aromia moschata TaxID=1265417 RepID=A0AAV8X8F4_9CUCU|nr:hypothetical protein NQ318_005621 [Aromia moschata]
MVCFDNRMQALDIQLRWPTRSWFIVDAVSKLEAKAIEDILVSRRPSCDSVGDQQHLHPSGFGNSHRRSPSLRRNSPTLQRSPSPRRKYPPHLHHDIGFSDTVSNVVEIVKHEHQRASQKRFARGSWSASTSPARSPSPTGGRHNSRYGPMRSSRRPDYGTTSLCQRSRSPSPTHPAVPHQQGPPLIAGAVVGIPMQQSAAHQGSMQHSHPMLGTRRQGRRLPPTPCKPSTLQLRPGTINFPKLNASPTHQQLQSQAVHATPHTYPHSFPATESPLEKSCLPAPVTTNIGANPGVRDSNQAPLSFEQAVALGRGAECCPVQYLTDTSPNRLVLDTLIPMTMTGASIC